MNLVERIGRMALRVPDRDAAVAFHTDVLGLVETERQGPVSYAINQWGGPPPLRSRRVEASAV